jgi:hypothetical protein
MPASLKYIILGFILLIGKVTQAQHKVSAPKASASQSLSIRIVNKASGFHSSVANESYPEERKTEFSIDIFSGATSIVTGLSLSNNGIYQYHYTPTFGFAGDLGYPLTSELSLHASLGYLQRGAEFDSVGFADQSRYRLSYIDLWEYLEYASGSQSKFTFLVGMSQSTLVAASLSSSDKKNNAMDDFKKFDVGLVAGPGILLPTTQDNKIRLRFIFSYGFRDAFAEGHFNDDIKAHNHAILIQLGYVFN